MDVEETVVFGRVGFAKVSLRMVEWCYGMISVESWKSERAFLFSIVPRFGLES